MAGHPQSAATRAKISAANKGKRRGGKSKSSIITRQQFLERTKNWTPKQWANWGAFVHGLSGSTPAQRTAFFKKIQSQATPRSKKV